MFWGKNRGRWKSQHLPTVEPRTPLAWAASALPLSHNSWTVTEILVRRKLWSGDQNSQKIWTAGTIIVRKYWSEHKLFAVSTTMLQWHICVKVSVLVSKSLKKSFAKQNKLQKLLNSCKYWLVCFNQNNSVADSACHYNSLVLFETSPGALRVTRLTLRWFAVISYSLVWERRPKMSVFNPD